MHRPPRPLPIAPHDVHLDPLVLACAPTRKATTLSGCTAPDREEATA